MTEHWVRIEGSPFDISDRGRVRAFVTGKLKRLHRRDGFKVFASTWPCDLQFRIHRKVYQAFIGDIPDGFNVGFRNGRKSDCSVMNLKLVKKISAKGPHRYYRARDLGRVITLRARGLSFRKIQDLTGVCYRTAHRMSKDPLWGKRWKRK